MPTRGAQTPIDKCDNLCRQFGPTRFNADEWVAIAKAAGRASGCGGFDTLFEVHVVAERWRQHHNTV